LVRSSSGGLLFNVFPGDKNEFFSPLFNYLGVFLASWFAFYNCNLSDHLRARIDVSARITQTLSIFLLFSETINFKVIILSETLTLFKSLIRTVNFGFSKLILSGG
jgi:hypothetical protein